MILIQKTEREYLTAVRHKMIKKMDLPTSYLLGNTAKKFTKNHLEWIDINQEKAQEEN